MARFLDKRVVFLLEYRRDGSGDPLWKNGSHTAMASGLVNDIFGTLILWLYFFDSLPAFLCFTMSVSMFCS